MLSIFISLVNYVSNTMIIIYIREKYYVDHIKQITRWKLITQNTKLANHQLMFLNKAFQPKAHNQGTL